VGAKFPHSFRPAPYTVRTGSFKEIKWPRRGVDHAPLSSVEIKERVEIHIYSGPLWAFVACCRVKFTFINVNIPHLTMEIVSTVTE
jgi:hypothetical protein